MLDRIQRLASGYDPQAAREEEITRQMLKTIKKGNGMIRESNEGQEESVAVTDDERFGDKVLSSEKNEIRTALNSNVKFPENPLSYYPKTGDLVLNGEIMDMNGTKFQYRFNDPNGDGCYIWANGIQLTDQNTKKLMAIRNSYLNWKDKWLKNSTQLEKFGSVR